MAKKLSVLAVYGAAFVASVLFAVQSADAHYDMLYGYLTPRGTPMGAAEREQLTDLNYAVWFWSIVAVGTFLMMTRTLFLLAFRHLRGEPRPRARGFDVIK